MLGVLESLATEIRSHGPQGYETVPVALYRAFQNHLTGLSCLLALRLCVGYKIPGYKAINSGFFAQVDKFQRMNSADLKAGKPSDGVLLNFMIGGCKPTDDADLRLKPIRLSRAVIVQ